MARSQEYWYNKMAAEKSSLSVLNGLQPNIDSSQTLFNDLTTKSKVAVWRLMFWCVAVCAYSLDVIAELAIITMTELAKNSRYGTEPWYAAIAKQFQYGDALTQVNLEYVYDPIDDTKMIVTHSATKEVVGGVILKVAKTVSGVPTKLSTLEYDAFVIYANKKKPSGIRLTIISDDPDEYRLWLTVVYDPLVLKANGELIGMAGVFPVEDAVKAYTDNLDFDGKFDLMKVIDYIQPAQGVISAYVTSASARYGVQPFVIFPKDYYPNAGHMVNDPTTPLSSTITYESA